MLRSYAELQKLQDMGVRRPSPRAKLAQQTGQRAAASLPPPTRMEDPPERYSATGNGKVRLL